MSAGFLVFLILWMVFWILIAIPNEWLEDVRVPFFSWAWEKMMETIYRVLRRLPH